MQGFHSKVFLYLLLSVAVLILFLVLFDCIVDSLRGLPESSLDEAPSLVVAARLPMMPSTPGNSLTEIKSKKCMWVLLQSVQTVCEYVLQKHSLAVQVS